MKMRKTDGNVGLVTIVLCVVVLIAFAAFIIAVETNKTRCVNITVASKEFIKGEKGDLSYFILTDGDGTKYYCGVKCKSMIAGDRYDNLMVTKNIFSTAWHISNDELGECYCGGCL
jgi:hypothetical protein